MRYHRLANLAALVLGFSSLAWAQNAPTPMQPSLPGTLRIPGQGGSRLGYSTLPTVSRTPGAPVGVTQIGQANPYSSLRTPGSNLGYVDGAFAPRPLGAGLGGAPIGTPMQGLYNNPAAPGYAAPTMAPAFSAPPAASARIPGYAPTAPPQAPTFAPAAAGFGLPSLSGLPATASPFAVPALPNGDPSRAFKPSATQPLNANAAVSTDDLDAKVAKAIDQFSRREYRECQALIRPLAQGSQATLAVRQVYIATLVANGSLKTAAYEAVQAAKAYPRDLFDDDTLVSLYKGHPDFERHFPAVEGVSRSARSSTAPEPGILWAMYLRVDQSRRDPRVETRSGDKNDPIVVLRSLKAEGADKEWLEKLQRSLDKK